MRVLATKIDCRKVAMALASHVESNAFFSTRSENTYPGNFSKFEFEVWGRGFEASGVFKKNDRSGVIHDSQFDVDDATEFATMVVAWSISHPTDVPSNVRPIIAGWRTKLSANGANQADDLAAEFGPMIWPVQSTRGVEAAAWARGKYGDQFTFHLGTFWFADQEAAGLFKMFWG